jgi:hypothetical protein
MTVRHQRRRLLTVTTVTVLAGIAIWVWPSAGHHATGRVVPVSVSPRPVSPVPSIVAVAGVLAGSLGWRRWNDSVWLPYSPDAGPGRETGGLVSGFARTDLGAGLAAVHLSVRSTYYAGPTVFDATIEDQLTGRHRDALHAAVRAEYETNRTRLHLAAGATVPFAGSVPTAFHTTFTSPEDASVEVVWVSAGHFYVASYRLVWIDGDWRLFAEDPTATAKVPVFTAMPAGYSLFPGVGGV